MQVVFTDPPPRQTSRKGRIPAQVHPWESIAEQVKRRPGEWALVLRNIYVNSDQITAGRNTVFRPAGTWDARTIFTGNRDEHGRRLVDLYIRYLTPTPTEENR